MHLCASTLASHQAKIIVLLAVWQPRSHCSHKMGVSLVPWWLEQLHRPQLVCNHVYVIEFAYPIREWLRGFEWDCSEVYTCV